MARHHHQPLSTIASRWSGNFQRSGQHSAAIAGQKADAHPAGLTAPVKSQPVEVPYDLKGKTDFFPEVSWRDALLNHLQQGRIAQGKAQLNNWRANGDHSKHNLSLLCAGESRHFIHDINFGHFAAKDFERVSLAGITFKRSVFPEGGEAFKKALEARGATFAGYRIGEQPYVVATQPASARGSQGR
jgi:hypothetical protein